jgi:hypothetical protein
MAAASLWVRTCSVLLQSVRASLQFLRTSVQSSGGQLIGIVDVWIKCRAPQPQIGRALAHPRCTRGAPRAPTPPLGAVSRYRIDPAPTQWSNCTMHAIEIEGRRFFALRRLGPRSRGTQVFHAVSPHCRMALCSIEPGNKSGWAEPPAAEVTCSVCLQRLQRLGAHATREKADRSRGSLSLI